MLETQKSIPIPKPTRKGAGRRRKYPLDVMEVGEMFFVPGLTENKLTTYISAVAPKLGRKFTTRLTTMVESLDGWQPCDEDAEGAVHGVGVWRTE